MADGSNPGRGPEGVKRINLALQGGGAHGAYTWGVLDRLLEDDGIEIAGVSGCSAGALNAVALKAGLAEGGRDRARQVLDDLWAGIAATGDLRMTDWMTAFLPALRGALKVMEAVLPVSPLDLTATVFSPYAYGPTYRNPLRPVVESLNFASVCRTAGPDTFVSATNVRTGKIRVFTGAAITTDSVLASACLPTVFQAIEIDDPATGRREAFWDGGYSGNPALFPLYEPHLPDDIVIVGINPLVRDELPFTATDIQNRVNEISFNASLLSEIRAIAFVKRLIAQGKVPAGAMKSINLHMIADDALMNELSAVTKLLPTPPFVQRLKEAGRASAEGFLRRHRGDLNARGTVDLVAALS
ncbi:MAG: patatin-like phospholipase family protein [Paracoccaceae bacterium]